MAPLDPRLARDAKTITLLAFRNGPLEALHAGVRCPRCDADPAYSHITDSEMKRLMQASVNEVYRLLWQREKDPEAYRKRVEFAERQTYAWDDPQLKSDFKETDHVP